MSQRVKDPERPSRPRQPAAARSAANRKQSGTGRNAAHARQRTTARTAAAGAGVGARQGKIRTGFGRGQLEGLTAFPTRVDGGGNTASTGKEVSIAVSEDATPSLCQHTSSSTLRTGSPLNQLSTTNPSEEQLPLVAGFDDTIGVSQSLHESMTPLLTGLSPAHSPCPSPQPDGGAGGTAGATKPLMPRMPTMGPSTSRAARARRRHPLHSTRGKLSVASQFRMLAYCMVFALRILRPARRRRALREKQRQQGSAAFVIQCCYRRFKQRQRLVRDESSRRIVRWMRRVLHTRLERRAVAAAMLQKEWRGKLGRNRVKEMIFGLQFSRVCQTLRAKAKRIEARRVLEGLRLLRCEREIVLSDCATGFYRLIRQEAAEWSSILTEAKSINLSVLPHHRAAAVLDSRISRAGSSGVSEPTPTNNDLSALVRKLLFPSPDERYPTPPEALLPGFGKRKGGEGTTAVVDGGSWSYGNIPTMSVEANQSQSSLRRGSSGPQLQLRLPSMSAIAHPTTSFYTTPDAPPGLATEANGPQSPSESKPTPSLLVIDAPMLVSRQASAVSAFDSRDSFAGSGSFTEEVPLSLVPTASASVSLPLPTTGTSTPVSLPSFEVDGDHPGIPGSTTGSPKASATSHPRQSPTARAGRSHVTIFGQGGGLLVRTGSTLSTRSSRSRSTRKQQREASQAYLKALRRRVLTDELELAFARLLEITETNDRKALQMNMLAALSSIHRSFQWIKMLSDEQREVPDEMRHVLRFFTVPWALRKARALLQEESEKRRKIEEEYDHTPIISLNKKHSQQRRGTLARTPFGVLRTRVLPGLGSGLGPPSPPAGPGDTDGDIFPQSSRGSPLSSPTSLQPGTVSSTRGRSPRTAAGRRSSLQLAQLTERVLTDVESFGFLSASGQESLSTPGPQPSVSFLAEHPAAQRTRHEERAKENTQREKAVAKSRKLSLFANVPALVTSQPSGRDLRSARQDSGAPNSSSSARISGGAQNRSFRILSGGEVQAMFPSELTASHSFASPRSSIESLSSEGRRSVDAQIGSPFSHDSGSDRRSSFARHGSSVIPLAQLLRKDSHPSLVKKSSSGVAQHQPSSSLGSSFYEQEAKAREEGAVAPKLHEYRSQSDHTLAKGRHAKETAPTGATTPRDEVLQQLSSAHAFSFNGRLGLSVSLGKGEGSAEGGGEGEAQSGSAAYGGAVLRSDDDEGESTPSVGSGNAAYMFPQPSPSTMSLGGESLPGSAGSPVL